MLLDWITYVCLIIVVLGWGLLFWKVASFCIGMKSRFPLWGELGLYGLFAIGILSTLFNFFSPLNYQILFFFSCSGLVLFFGFLSQHDEASKSLTKSLVFFSITIAFFLTLFAAYNKFFPDAGLYHLPYQLWMRKEPVVLGLANLHDRFGFNSILEAISATFWLSNNNFILVCFVESFFIFFFYLTLLEFLLRNPARYRGLSIYFCLLSPLSILMLDDYFSYRVTNTDVPAAFTALLCVFSFLRLADRLRDGEGVEAEFLSLNLLAAFAIALKVSSVPILILIAFSYYLLFDNPLVNRQYFIRVNFLAALTLLPTISRNLAVTGCFVFPIEKTCVSQLPWSAEHIATTAGDAIKAWARAPGPGFFAYLTGWDWLPLWGERYLELLFLLLATTFAIFVCGYFHAHISLKQKSTLEANQIEITGFLPTIAILLVLFESVALAFWFLNAPDVRFGILPLHMFTLLPALLTLSIYDKKPQTGARGSLWYTVFGIVLIVSCILKISDPPKKRFMHTSHLFKVSLKVPEVETIPVLQYGVRPVKPDGHNCWTTKEPCSPSRGWYREFDVGSIGPFKAFLRR